ncbi:MAG: hypothetical protein ACK5PS_07945 [Desulfopila sp.]
MAPSTQHPSPAQSADREPVHPSLTRRWARFVLLLGLTLLVVYGILPLLTRSVPILAEMSAELDSNGIDPSRYYYTDVEQVAEAEQYLHSVLADRKGK